MTDRDGFVEQSLELIGRLETAAEGDRELDGLMHGAEHGLARNGCTFMLEIHGRETFQFRHPTLRHPNGPAALYVSGYDVPHVTTSLDAALGLAERVLPGAGWSLSRNGFGVIAEVHPYEPDTRTEAQKMGLSFTTYEPKTPPFGSAQTPALALCAAILRATPEGMRKPLEDMETGR